MDKFITKKWTYVGNEPRIINIKKKELNKKNIKNFQEWISKSNSLYIGRDMCHHVNGTYQSKWHNPFSHTKYKKYICLEMYENYIKNTPKLYDSLNELTGKELGCWCSPSICHGDILIKLWKEKNEIKI